MKKNKFKYMKERGTINLKSFDEFNQVCEEFKGQVVSPGGAAGMLHVSRAYIHQLEKEKRIRAFRFSQDDFDEKLTHVIRVLLNRTHGEYIYIPIVDLEEYQASVRKKK